MILVFPGVEGKESSSSRAGMVSGSGKAEMKGKGKRISRGNKG